MPVSSSGSSKGSTADFRGPELTGLEPATSAVTGRRSNQLSYNSSEKVVKLELNLCGFNRKFLRKQRRGGAGAPPYRSVFTASDRISRSSSLLTGSFPGSPS